MTELTTPWNASASKTAVPSYPWVVISFAILKETTPTNRIGNTHPYRRDAEEALDNVDDFGNPGRMCTFTGLATVKPTMVEETTVLKRSSVFTHAQRRDFVRRL